jgi:hypothetical protein
MARRSHPVVETVTNSHDSENNGSHSTVASVDASESPNAATNTATSNATSARGAAVLPRRRGPLQRLRKRRTATDSSHDRPRLMEEHYRVDTDKQQVLPGLPVHEDDWARDSHDFFNLVVLVPLVALNVMNWNWDLIFSTAQQKTVADCWTGEWFDLFFKVTAIYFMLDLLWIVLLPTCVKSPATIVQHHLATCLYILIPYRVPQTQWCMGACMSVELNTWFLIARRVFNKQGFPPWVIDLSFFSFRVKLISTFFYITWIGIRCLLYPYLMIPFYQEWVKQSAAVGTKWNVVFLCVPLHACFCLLNLKWSYDLLMSKVRYWRRKGNYKEASKGL